MAETIAVIDYGSGNLRSVAKAFERVAADHAADTAIAVTSDPDMVRRADRIVLPGVGAFAAAMAALNRRDGLLPALEEVVLKSKRPFLGICVGMQILADVGHEFEGAKGLGWIAGDVLPLTPHAGLPVPHMGWTEVIPQSGGDAFPALRRRRDFYFVHSFHFVPKTTGSVWGGFEYGQALTAVVGRENILGVQFHPEKSQAAGLDLIADFMAWRP